MSGREMHMLTRDVTGNASLRPGDIAQFARRLCMVPSRMSMALIALGSLVLTFGLMGSSLEAHWGLTDDHEILRWVGADGEARLTEVPGILAQTEVGQPGRATRYRPTYYSLRLLETVLWGDSPRLWYMTRLALFGFSLAVFWRSLERWLGLGAASVLVLYCLTYPFWGDIFCRLGPGEAYCVPGLALFAFGCGSIVHATSANSSGRPSRLVAPWALVTIGALLAMGSKENFLWMAPAGLALHVWTRAKRQASVAGLVAVGIMSLYAVGIGASVAIALVRAGHDVYHADITVGERIGGFGAAISRLAHGIEPIEWVALGALAGILLLLRKALRAHMNVVLPAGIAVALLGLLYATQYVYYSGFLPTGGRYDFPAALVKPVAWTCIGMAVLRVAWRSGRARVSVLTLAVGMVLALVVIRVEESRFSVRWIAAANAQRTQRLAAALDRVERALHETPGRPLLVTAHSWWDYESCYALRYLLEARSVPNPLFLMLAWPPGEEPESAMEAEMAKQLRNWSSGGGAGYSPLRAFGNDAPCVSVGLSGDAIGPCERMGRLW